ncbi:MAG: hypothetical protein HY842_00935, partial [Bacteroidetes bacterium]|nr:hypothetical protein [Bacteroidota bacterium]
VLCKGDKAKAIEMFQQSLSEVNEIEKINHYKNYSLYTSFYENKVKTPSELISHENLNKVKESAINRLVAATTVVNTALDNLEEMEKYINDHPLDKIDPEEWAKEFWEQFD